MLSLQQTSIAVFSLKYRWQTIVLSFTAESLRLQEDQDYKCAF